MNLRDFRRAGHLPTLGCAFLYFDISFMVWVLLGPLGVQIAQSLELDAAQKGLMVAIPLLAGAPLRVVNGILVDHLRPSGPGSSARSSFWQGCWSPGPTASTTSLT